MADPAVSAETITKIFRLLKKAKDDGLSAVFVHRPDVAESETGETFPDLVVSNSTDAAVISALLGHYKACWEDNHE